MKTAVVEKDRVGGRCLNHACIPARAVLRVADGLSEVRGANEFGIKVAERGLKRHGIEIHTSTPVQNVQSSDSSVTSG
jgi:hypothetical protein